MMRQRKTAEQKGKRSKSRIIEHKGVRLMKPFRYSGPKKRRRKRKRREEENKKREMFIRIRNKNNLKEKIITLNKEE